MLQQARGPRAFFSNLLNRSPRAVGTSLPAPVSPPPRSPSAPSGFQHPAIGAALRLSHARSSSMPSSAPPFSSGISEQSSGQRRTPRSLATETFSNLARSASLRVDDISRLTSPQSTPSPRLSAQSAPSSRPAESPAASLCVSSTTTPLVNGHAVSTAPFTSLASIGLAVAPLTQPLSSSRISQVLCGAILDDKYLLIGTPTFRVRTKPMLKPSLRHHNWT